MMSGTYTYDIFIYSINNDNLTSNKFSERRDNINVINISNNIVIGLNTSAYRTNYNNGDSNTNINCFYDVSDKLQHAKARIKLKVIIITNSNMYNGDSMKNYFHDNDSTNTNNVSTTLEHLKVRVRVILMIDFVATKDSLSLFPYRNPFNNNINIASNEFMNVSIMTVLTMTTTTKISILLLVTKSINVVVKSMSTV